LRARLFLLGITRTTGVFLVLLMAAVSAGRVAATYRVFTETNDEGTHLACGLEWIERGTYSFEHLHPPLARVAVALGPYLAGARLGDGWRDDAGTDALYRGGYFRLLSLARLGILPFLLLSILVVWLQSERLLGVHGGVLAVLLLTGLPPILAHSGVATNDMPVAACLVAAFYAFARWLENPSPAASVALGVTVALACLAKATAVFFFPLGAAAILLCHIGRTGSGEELVAPSAAGAREAVRAIRAFLRPACGVLLVAVLVFWAGYRFSLAPVAEADPDLPQRLERRLAGAGPLAKTVSAMAQKLPVPAPEAWSGLVQLRNRLLNDQESYFLGKVVKNGHRLFFPVVFAVKTPLPFLILLFVGVAAVFRPGRRAARQVAPPLAAAVLIFVPCLWSKVNLGVRYLLPIYPLLAMVAAAGALELWRSRRWLARVAVVVLLFCHVAVSIQAHPDYLAYFNALAGRDPGRIVVDPDLDWGQDLQRLAREVSSRGITELHLAYYGAARPNMHIHAKIVATRRDVRPEGWVAISETPLRSRPQDFPWLRGVEPLGRAGRSILLYYLPRH